MNAHSEYMLSAVLDVFRLRQYFNVITRTRELLEGGVREDAGFLADAGRAVLPLPDATRGQHFRPFPPFSPYPTTVAKGQRVALVATGGSGALASVVGVARAFEEGGVRPAVISLCSGSRCSVSRSPPDSPPRKSPRSSSDCGPTTISMSAGASCSAWHRRPAGDSPASCAARRSRTSIRVSSVT